LNAPKPVIDIAPGQSRDSGALPRASTFNTTIPSLVGDFESDGEITTNFLVTVAQRTSATTTIFETRG
jgi:hypothetical protein